MNTMQWFELPNAPAPGSALCRLDDIPDNGAKLLWISAAGIGDSFSAGAFGLILLRSQGTVRAYVNRCAHFGAPLAEKPEHLIFEAGVSVTCNVHYARYSWQEGRCLRGECDGGALIAVPLAVDEAGTVAIAEPAALP